MTDYTKLVAALRFCAGAHTKHTECPDYDDSCGCGGKCLDKHFISAADAIEALQTEVEILKVSGREAYFEGLAAGAKPKLGEWVEDTTTYAGPGLSNYKCSLCGKICGTWRSGLKHDELPNWCGNCGAKMMEVQDG